MRLTAAANKNPVNGSTTTIAIRQTSILSPTLVARGVGFGATIRAERRKEDAEQGRKYAAAGADEMTSLSLSKQNCRDCSDNLDHESRFIACEKRLDRELARHGKGLSLHLNQNVQFVLWMKHPYSIPQ